MAESEAHPNAQTIRRLYAGIQAHNPDEIAACYADDATFKDIAFDLRGKPQVMQMWQMICLKTKPTVTFGTNTKELPAPTADAETGSGRWRADYYFGKTEDGKFGDTETNKGRHVDNWLTSKFKFQGNKIIEHHDDCNLLLWALQAMPLHKAFGAVAFPRKRKEMAQEKLDKFMKSLPPAERARFAAAPAPGPAPTPV